MAPASVSAVPTSTRCWPSARRTPARACSPTAAFSFPLHTASGSAGCRTAHINGQPIRFRWLIGADGQASSVRRWAGLDRTRRRSLRFGFRTHYRVAPWSDFVEVHWGRGGQLYITPVAPDCVCVVYITRDPRAVPNRAPTSSPNSPRSPRRLAGAEVVSQQRGAVTASCKLHRVATDSVALIGDASGSADAITGEGLAICFRQALALAASIDSGSLEPYRRAHRQIGKLPIAMGELMLTLDRWPALQVRALRALAPRPSSSRNCCTPTWARGACPPYSFRRGPRFGWNLLAKGAGA